MWPVTGAHRHAHPGNQLTPEQTDWVLPSGALWRVLSQRRVPGPSNSVESDYWGGQRTRGGGQPGPWVTARRATGHPRASSITLTHTPSHTHTTARLV